MAREARIHVAADLCVGRSSGGHIGPPPRGYVAADLRVGRSLSGHTGPPPRGYVGADLRVSRSSGGHIGPPPRGYVGADLCVGPSRVRLACAIVAVVFLAACKREARQFREIPPGSTTYAVAVSDLHPGGGSPPPPAKTPYELNAQALSEGKRLYGAYNCSGCHGNGGGAIGPALMDDEWAYGHEAGQIYKSILEGRPNGMPAFAGKIPDFQIWEIVAYVRSLGGLAPKDAAPSRSDHMSGKPPESSTPRQQPRNSALPPSAIR